MFDGDGKVGSLRLCMVFSWYGSVRLMNFSMRQVDELRISGLSG